MIREEAIAPLKLYGRTLRCWWCGKKIDHEARQIIVEISGKQHEAAVCSHQHGGAVIDAYRHAQKVFPLFLAGMAVGLLLLIGSNFSARPVSFVAAGFFTLGVTLIVCPFATPQTVRAVGMKNSMAVVRFLGIGIIAAALLFLWRSLS